MKKLIGLMSLLLLAACSPQKSSVKSNVNTGANVTIGGMQVGGQCATTGANFGAIYDHGQTSYNFESQVKGLLSATVAPNEVGSIYPQMDNGMTGVLFEGLIKLDSSGNVVGSQSNFKIKVYDSYYQTHGIIEVAFTPQKGATISGQFDTQSGSGYLSLRDQYGEIRFTGQINAQTFSGTVSYQNSVNVVAGAQPASGTIGQFQVSRCALFQ